MGGLLFLKGAASLTTFGLKIPAGILSGGIIGGLELERLSEVYDKFRELFAQIDWLKQDPWYESLCLIDFLIYIDRLNLLGERLQQHQAKYDQDKTQQEDAYVRGLCDRLVRIAYRQEDTAARDDALKLLKGLKEGQIAWAKPSIQPYIWRL